MTVYNNKWPSLYLNGTQVKTAQAASTQTAVYPSAVFGDVFGGSTPGYGPYSGQMGEVAVYKRALTAQEIQTLYQNSNRQIPTIAITSPGQTTKYKPGDTGSATITASSTAGIDKIYCSATGVASGEGLAAYFDIAQAETTQQLNFQALPSASPDATIRLTCVAQTVDGVFGVGELKLQVADTVPPTVASSTPANNAMDVSATMPITVTFSEAMDTTSFKSRDTFKFQRADNGTFVTGMFGFSSDNKTLIIIPSPPLDAATTYTVTFSGVHDVASNALANTAIQFTTLQQTSLTVDGQGTPATPYVLPAGRYGNLTLNNSKVAISGEVIADSITITNSTVNVTPGALNAPGNLSVAYGDMQITGSQVTVNGAVSTYGSLNLDTSAMSFTGNGTIGNDLKLTGSTLTLKNPVTVTHDVSLTSNSLLTHFAATTTDTSKLDITAANMTIEAGSKIDVSGKGYLGGYQKGDSSLSSRSYTDCYGQSYAPSAGENSATTGRTNGNIGGIIEKNGGSYGGTGGAQNGSLNAAYGDPSNPNELGSGGGGYYNNDYFTGICYVNWVSSGGNGGGLVRLSVASLNLNGAIVANGVSAQQGGGSGGGIRLDVNNISGSGTISANGGNSTGGYMVGNGGGGGGGRIAIYYGSMTPPNTNVLVKGGSGNPNGGTGTIYYKKADSSFGDLIISSDDKNAQTTLPGGTYGTISITNATLVTTGEVTASSIELNNSVMQATKITAGEVSLTSNSVLTHPATTTSKGYSLDLTVFGTLSIAQDSKLDVSGRGYLGEHPWCSGNYTGYTLGNTMVGGSSEQNGGSYGGLGGVNSAGGITNTVYGDPADPNELGSGGGGWAYYCKNGGNGGGLVRLKAGTLILNGSIVADGAAVERGGGSGGGIRIDANNISGSGTVSAKGGVSNGGYGGVAGGGGGGRIAVYYGTMTLPVANILATGGSGNPSGGSGTVYLKNFSSAAGDMIVSSGDRNTQTMVPGGTYNTISVTNGTVIVTGEITATSITLNNAVMQATKITTNSATLTSNGLLTHPSSTLSKVYSLDLTVTGTMSIDSTSKIDVSGRGYLGGHQGGNSGYTGRTYGNTTTGGSTEHNGAGYSGFGGLNNTSGRTNVLYGDPTNPNEVGSGGGGWEYWGKPGGNGGGLIRLKAGTLALDGNIVADGLAVERGGGSGGGIRIDADIITGTGTVSAKGGVSNGGYGGIAGGGGGGRIAIYYGAMTLPITNISVNGGSGNPSGGAGTVYLKNNTNNTDQLVVDNHGIDTAEGSTMLLSVGKGTVTAVTATTLTANGMNWQPSSLKGLKFAPDITQSKLFTIIDNTATTLQINPSEGDLTQATTLGAAFSGTYTFTKLTVQGKGRLSGLDRFVIGDEVLVDNSTLATSSVTANKVTVSNNGVMTHNRTTSNQEYRLELNVTTSVAIDSTSKIDVSGRGYLGGHQGNNSSYSGLTIGNTLTGGSSEHNGASYGGFGGVNNTSGKTNEVYGDSTNPNEVGSGGGGWEYWGKPGGNGGGLIRLKAGTLALDGNIVADGLAVERGGGSGGGIRIDADSITGTGTVSAKGGGSNGGYGGVAGGGSGGRIAIYYGSMTLPITNILSAGGSGNPSGGAGTVYVKSSTSPVGDLIISSTSSTNTQTILPSGTYGTISATNSTLVATGMIVASTVILSNSTVTLPESSTSNAYHLDLTVLGTLSIDSTSRIDVSGRGYLGGRQGDNTSYIGRTLGNTTVGGSGELNGGSYGGLGGKVNANALYGDLYNPNEVGSGGGGQAYNGYRGGNGGGLALISAGTLILDGGVVADGSSATAGGGSGGGIRIDAMNISGIGMISAKGGPSNNNGGGGGGRIAIYYGSMTLPNINVLANGGSGNPSGSSGTVHFVNPLTVTKSGTGTGSVTSTPTGISCGTTCSAQFAANSSVALTAVPVPGSTFTGWSGACSGTGTCTVTMDAAKNVTATFTSVPPPTVTITSPSGFIKSNKPLLQYTVSNGTVVVKVDGAVVNKVSGNNLDLLPDGSHTVYVEATNAGGTGFADNSFVVDTVAPVLSVTPVTTPSPTSSYTLTGTMEAGANLNISANTTATAGPISFGTGTWSCTVSNLVPGANTFTVTALDQATNSSTASVIVTYEPAVAMALSTNTIAADYQGTVGLAINNIYPAGGEILMEQLVDANQNGVADTGDYVIRSFKVTDGAVATHPNTQGDTDGAVNGIVTTELSYFLKSDLYHTPGHYLFRATKDTQNSVVQFTVSPVSQTQTIAGMLTDGANPIPGAIVQLTDKWQRHVAYAIADTSGSYLLNVKQPGSYNLLPLAYGYVASTTPVTLVASQNIENLNLSLTADTNHVTGNVKDATSGAGIAGVWVQASDGNNSGIAITDSSGVYDLLLPPGQYSVNTFAGATGPGAFAKGYTGFNKQPLTITVNGNIAATDINLPVGDITVTGRILDTTGNPVAGIPVMGRIRGTVDNREPVSFGISDAAGNYSLGLFSGANGDISLDNVAAQTLGYLGTIRQDLSTTVGPLNGNDLTVYPISAWVQGVVKNSAGQLLSGVEVKLRNSDSSITASVVSASDGTYRLGAFAGSWFIDALTENRGIHPVTEQSFTLSDGQSSTMDFVVDVTPPTESINPVTSPTKAASQTITGTMEAGAIITVSVNTTASAGPVSYPTSTTWSCDIAGLVEGANIITITATDVAENPSVATTTITLDTLPPTVAITSPTSGTTANQTPLLMYTASDGVIVVKVDNVAVNKISGNMLDTLSFGSHTVRIEATDAAGNLGFVSVTFTVNRPPAFNPTTFSRTNATVGIAYSGQTIAGAAVDPDGDVITYTKISGPAWLTVAANGTLGGTPTAAANDSFVVRATATGGTADATLNITVTAAPAAVAQLNAWTNLYSASPNNTSTSNLAAGSFTVGSGSNRLLLVAVVMETGAAANPIISASYGGIALTQIKVTANTQREIVWVGYLKESQIGSGAKALTVSYSGATKNASALHVKWSAFSNVNQTTPIAGSGGLNTATTSATFGNTVNYVNNGMTTVVAGNGGTPATGTLSATPAFTAGSATTSNAQTSRTFTTARHTAAGSYASTTPVTWSGTTSKWSGVVAVSLQP